MENKLEQGSTWSRLNAKVRAAIASTATIPVLLHGLLAVVLTIAVASSAWLLADLHARNRLRLDDDIKFRTTMAASALERQVANLVTTLRLVWTAPLSTKESRDAFYSRASSALEGTGITLIPRTRSLALSPENASGAQVSFGQLAQAAASKALATRQPQITSFENSHGDGGTDLWLAAGTNTAEPIVLQAHIPASYFNTTLQRYAGAENWFLAILGSDGKFLASSGQLPEKQFVFRGATIGASQLDGLSADYAEALAETNLFGWRVGTALPLATIQGENRKNWLRFLIVASLLTLASFAATSALSRRILTSIDASSSGSPLQRLEPTNNQTKDEFPTHDLKGDNEPYVGAPLRAALDAGGIAFWQWHPGSKTMIWNRPFAELLALKPDTIMLNPASVLQRVDKRDRRRLVESLRQSLVDAGPFATDVEIKCFDGVQRWFAARGTAITARNGTVTTIVGVGYDITDQKQNASRTDALLREVTHRSKNILALILAMARLTGRDAADVKSHLKDFALRVAGISASQDLIVAAEWQSVDLAALALAEIEAVARSEAGRISITGPSFSVTPEAAQTLGMILAEMTLNALEHGALSVPKGEVRLVWEFPEPGSIAFTWRETGGPGYDAMWPRGYGMSMVDRFSSQGLKLRQHIAGDDQGLIWTLVGPISNLGTLSPPHRA